MTRIIGHLDMDAFFAAIEERDNPQFRGLPIVVCTSTLLSADPSSPLAIEYEDDAGQKRSANPELVARSTSLRATLSEIEWVEGSGADPRGGKGRGVVSTANYKAREIAEKMQELCAEFETEVRWNTKERCLEITL